MGTVVLTASLAIVLVGVGETPASAYEIRDRIGLPRTGPALTNVRRALDTLARVGVITKDPRPEGSMYSLRVKGTP